MEKINVYLAGSMFCDADKMFNAYLAKQIRSKLSNKINLYVPQENKSINDKTKCADSNAIFWGDYNRLLETDILIARIDGDVPPSGTSAEIGIMARRVQDYNKLLDFVNQMPDIDSNKEIKEKMKNYIGKRKPMILGLCTDGRNPKLTYLEAKNELMKTGDIESQYCYYNLFTIGCIKTSGSLVTNSDQLIKVLSNMVDAMISNEE